MAAAPGKARIDKLPGNNPDLLHRDNKGIHAADTGHRTVPGFMYNIH